MANGSPGSSPSSDPDDLLRSGAHSGLKRDFARILRSQADFALSRTRSGDSSASNRHTLSKRAKKSPLAAGQSPIPPILSPAGAAAATSIQNETHAANLVRSPMITAGMSLLATPKRRFTRSMLVQRDPAAGSKTLVDEQATPVLEIPGDGSNMQTSVKLRSSRLKKEIDEDGAEMTMLATPARRFTRSLLVQRPSIAGEGDPAAGSKTNRDEQAKIVGSNMQTSVFTPGPSKSSKKPRIKFMSDKNGAGMTLLATPGRRFTRSALVQTPMETPSVAGEGDPAPVQTAGEGDPVAELKTDVDEQGTSALVQTPMETPSVAGEGDPAPVQTPGEGDPVQTPGEGDPAAELKTDVDEQGTSVLEGDGSNMQSKVFTPDPNKSSKKQRAKFMRSRSNENGAGMTLPNKSSKKPRAKLTRSRSNENGAGMALLGTSGRRFTRSAFMQTTSIAGQGDPAVGSNTNVDEQLTIVLEKRTDEDGSNEHKVLERRFTRLALNIPKIDQEMSTKETLTAKHDGDECKVSKSTPGKRVLRFTRSTVETPAAKHDEELKADDSTLGKRAIRFTRSALKPPDEDSVSESTETDTSESLDSEELKSRNKLRKTLKKKMELKMSKKIGLTKLPANLRDLFATGLLEGYPVRYNCNDKQQISLEGVIRGNMISCNCPSCKGSQTFSGYNWEVHAGSNKRHPSDNIFLENGKSLHDVLKACMSAPLNMLEATIQNVIGAPPRKRPSICQTCGVSFRSSYTGEPAPSCHSCLKTEQLRPKARLSNGTLSIGKPARRGSLPDPSNSASTQKYGKITKKDIGLHKLVFMDDILPEGTEVAYYHRGERLLEGYIKDSGIYCLHCNVVVKPSVFEAHAGRATRRKPFHNIYTSNGVSLHELSVSLSKGRKLSTHENDDLCNICNDGGDLLLCDLCPRSFHRGCLGLLEVPEGDWHCPPCQTMHQKERFVEYNDNAIAAGRVDGVDPIEQIIKRCIRIFTSPRTVVGGCVLCRLHDFSKAAFGDRTVLICDQCEKEYHVGCLREHNMCDLNALPEGDWFCCADCQRINAALQELLIRGQEPLKDLDADIIRKKKNEKDLSKDGFDVSWVLLSGKTASADSRLLLSETVSLFSEAFDPIVGASGRDLIPSFVNGENMGDQDFRGMYCVVLTSNSHIVSAGILRILGSELAELPLAATSREAQGQGYFQALFSCIERLLGSLNVKHFVLPAAEEALSIWTKKFGFRKIASEQLHEYAKGVHPMVFQGTSMLHKPVPQYQDSS